MTAKLRLAEIETASKALEAERQAILDKEAREACPFVPGDLVEFQSGKNRITRTVQKVFAKYGDYTMAVANIRADGAVLSYALATSFDLPVKVEA